MRNRFLTLGIAVLALGFVACDDADSVAGPDGATSESETVTIQEAAARGGTPGPDGAASNGRAGLPTIAAIAATTEDFELGTLVAALQAAGLVGTFDGDRQYTVFAPTDAAFGALLANLDLTANELLADTELLTAVLLYHVTPGDRSSTSVVNSGQVRMLNGQSADVTTSGSEAFIDAAPIVATDIVASNGRIHVIDAVLVPEF